MNSKPFVKKLARVLLADGDLASRLTLKSLLSAAGYSVDCAASASEAAARLDTREYELVLADLAQESDQAGEHLLAYARQKEFRPATALISSSLSEIESDGPARLQKEAPPEPTHRTVRMSQEDVSDLLARVAELISRRAGRRSQQSLRLAS